MKRFLCIAETPYQLFLYLLYQNESFYEKTTFFLGNIHNSIANNLPNHISVSNSDAKVIRRKLLFRPLKYSRYKIFACDHMEYAISLIGSHRYSLIEDSSGVMSCYETSNPPGTYLIKGKKNTIYSFINFGPIFGKSFGQNKQCINRIITSRKDTNSRLVKGRKFELIDISHLWNSSSNYKKLLITRYFNIDKIDFYKYKFCRTIVFMQPWKSILGFSDSQIRNLYYPAISDALSEGVVIKPHPGESTDYSSIFPECEILNTLAPFQLLLLCGLSFDKAINFTSTAISMLPEETEIIWINPDNEPKLTESFGCNASDKLKNIRASIWHK